MQVTRYIAVSVTLVMMVAGCAQVKPAAVLGARPSDTPPVRIASLSTSKQPQTISGTMIDKCPIAGCWFHVKDSTGVIKVDTKNSGFVVTDVPINSHVTVTGLMRGSDHDQTLTATGMSYR